MSVMSENTYRKTEEKNELCTGYEQFSNQCKTYYDTKIGKNEMNN